MSEKLYPPEIANEEKFNEGRKKIQNLIEKVRNSKEYLEKKNEWVKKGATEEEFILSFEGGKNQYQSGTDYFKQIFWDYIEDFHDKNKLYPLNFDDDYNKDRFPEDIGMLYTQYADLNEKLKGSKTINSYANDIEKTKIHDEIASKLVERNFVPSHLWGRLVARLWTVSEELDDIDGSRMSDELRMKAKQESNNPYL